MRLIFSLHGGVCSALFFPFFRLSLELISHLCLVWYLFIFVFIVMLFYSFGICYSLSLNLSIGVSGIFPRRSSTCLMPPRSNPFSLFFCLFIFYHLFTPN